MSDLQQALLEMYRRATIRQHDLDRIARVLVDFYRAPLSMSSVQPILDLAVELNPELKHAGFVMPNPQQQLE